MPEPIGLPVLFDGESTDEDRRHLHYGEVGLEDGELVTSGIYGWTMVVTGVGASIAAHNSAQTPWPIGSSCPTSAIAATSAAG